MKGIISVLGKDQVGIIAKVSSYLAINNINVLDLSQTITQDNFHMIMIVDLRKSLLSFDVVSSELESLGNEISLVIKLQNEAIFNAMHRI